MEEGRVFFGSSFDRVGYYISLVVAQALDWCDDAGC